MDTPSSSRHGGGGRRVSSQPSSSSLRGGGGRRVSSQPSSSSLRGGGGRRASSQSSSAPRASQASSSSPRASQASSSSQRGGGGRQASQAPSSSQHGGGGSTASQSPSSSQHGGGGSPASQAPSSSQHGGGGSTASQSPSSSQRSGRGGRRGGGRLGGHDGGLGSGASPPPFHNEPGPSRRSLYLPKRSAYGKVGKPCLIRANHVRVTYGNVDPHQYRVIITPVVESTKKRRELIKLACSLDNIMLVYDGSEFVYSAGPLPFISKTFPLRHINESGHAEYFMVVLDFVDRLEVNYLRRFLGSQGHNPKEVINALNIVLKESASIGRVLIGGSVFGDQFGKAELGNGIEYWRGLFTSTRPTQVGLTINLDVAARPFYQPLSITEFIQSSLRETLSVNKRLKNEYRIKVQRELRHVEVEACYGDKRRYTIQALTHQPLSQLMREDRTIVEYFAQEHNINIQFAHLPAVQAGTDLEPIYLPVELLKIVDGQSYPRMLNKAQSGRLKRAICQHPNARANNIKMPLQAIKYNEIDLVKEFGMRVDEQLIRIRARILPPPSLEYHDSSKVIPKGGEWNTEKKKFILASQVQRWAAVNFSSKTPEQVKHFCNMIGKKCREKGMGFARDPVTETVSGRLESIEEKLRDLHNLLRGNGNQLQLVIVILPEKKNDSKGEAYGRIKRLCDIELGLMTQCCKPETTQNCNTDLLENLAMKINAKVGGRNYSLSNLPYVPEDTTIIFGADVSHPSPGDHTSPSIAAVVASMDGPKSTRYKAVISAQTHRREIIQDLYTTRNGVPGGMIMELLQHFNMSTGNKPERIIFYRDGVGESQFNEVMITEMVKIRAACDALECFPRITYILMQKRHHTRFFPEGPLDGDRNGNILPGTVVDTHVCHPREFDFYLCSHAGIKGTSRPMHYHVLFDEDDISPDDLQMLTYHLCHTCVRSSRSFALVPPAYYADLAAYRGRFYIKAARVHGKDVADGEVMSLPPIHDNVKDLMFFV